MSGIAARSRGNELTVGMKIANATPNLSFLYVFSNSLTIFAFSFPSFVRGFIYLRAQNYLLFPFDLEKERISPLLKPTKRELT